MLEFLGSLLWPVVIVASTIAIAFAIGVFMATLECVDYTIEYNWDN